MKLRIRGSSLRLRLTPSEVAEIGEGSAVEERVEFGGEPAQQLVYALVPSDDFESLTARFDSGRIAVFIPRSQANDWARANQIGVETEKTITGQAETLRILIEKDFACLEPRAGEEDTDAFARPLQNRASDRILLKAFD